MCGSIVASVPVAMTTILRGDQPLAAAVDVVQFDGVRVVEGSRRCDQFDAVARKLMADEVDLVPDHLIGAEQAGPRS